MTLGNILSSLGASLYDLPKKAVVYATASEIGLKPNCESVDRAGSLYETTVTKYLNPSSKDLSIDQMREYAIGGFDKLEGYTHLRTYLEKCGMDPDKIAPLTESGQKLVDTAYQFYEEEGIEIPFTGEPVLDAMIAGGIVVGSTIGLSKIMRNGKFSNLFYNYKL